MRRRAGLVLALALVAGCVFRNSAVPRYFAPESTLVAADDPPAGTRAGRPIRLAAVHGTSFLRERIVWRGSAVEYGHYEQRLWKELPASYVERALAAGLRRAPGIDLTDDARAAVLAVDVLAFDEVLSPEHVATVTLAVRLRDLRRGRLLDRTFSADAPIADDDPATMVKAMGRALDEATVAVADAVARVSRPEPAGGRPTRPGRRGAR